MKKRLYYNDFYKQNQLKKLFQIFILLIVLIAGAWYGIYNIQNTLQPNGANVKAGSLKSINIDEVMPLHPSDEPYACPMSMRRALSIMKEQESTLSRYMKGKYEESDKEKLLYRFIVNLEYYTEVFTEQNAHRYYQNKHDSFYAGSIKLKMHLNKTVDDVEIERTDEELKPPNIKSPNVRLYSPAAPFVKLVFEGYFNNGKATYYVLVPDYKYISDKYSKYLSKNWLDYFDIKTRQQLTLRNCMYRNGNGGRFPYYISDNDVNGWTNSLINLIQANPDFIMYNDIAEEIIYDNYPNYDFLLKKVDKDTKLYTKLKQAKLSVEAE